MEFISNVVELISAFRSETRQDAITPDSLGSLLLRMINALRYAWSSSTHPFYHIQCDTKDGRLIVKHPTDLMEKGYVPYLLRYSKKKPRYRTSRIGTLARTDPLCEAGISSMMRRSCRWHLMGSSISGRMSVPTRILNGFMRRTAEICSGTSERLRRKAASSSRWDSVAVCIASRAITDSASGWCSDRLCPRRATAR